MGVRGTERLRVKAAEPPAPEDPRQLKPTAGVGLAAMGRATGEAQLEKGLRERSFRLVFALWALGAAVGLFFAFADLSSQRGAHLVRAVASTVNAIAVWSALVWGAYGTTIWIAAGFTSTTPPSISHAAAVTAVTLIVFLASVVTERRAENTLQEQTDAEKARLMELYRGAGQIQEWCVANHGVAFGRQDFIRAALQRQCEAVRAKNEHADRK